MALSKTVTALVSNQTCPASSSIVSSVSVDLAEAIDLEITSTMTFSSSTNAGARVELYSDPTGANASFSIGARDEPLDAFDVQNAAGYTKNKAEQMKRCSRYAKVKVVNQGNQAITGITIRAIVQKQ